MATLGIFDRTGDDQLRQTLMGSGRSVASTQLAQGNRAIQNQAYSMAAGQRGGNPALAMRNAQNAAASAQVEHNYNQAKLRAAEQAQAQQLAQVEDAKRGQVIGGVLGGVGAALGSLAGPAGTAAGAAVGNAAGQLATGKPENAFGALGNGLVGEAAKLAPGSEAAKAALTNANFPVQPMANPLANSMANAGNAMRAGYAPQAAAAAPAQAHGGVAPNPAALANPGAQVQSGVVAAEQRGGGTGIAMQTAPQQVAANQPLPEGQHYVPAAMLAQSMQPLTTTPQVPASLPTGPSPVYGNNTAPGSFGGERNGQGGTAPLFVSPEQIQQYLAFLAKGGV